jgi:hypothetical protein
MAAELAPSKYPHFDKCQIVGERIVATASNLSSTGDYLDLTTPIFPAAALCNSAEAFPAELHRVKHAENKLALIGFNGFQSLEVKRQLTIQNN